MKPTWHAPQPPSYPPHRPLPLRPTQPKVRPVTRVLASAPFAPHLLLLSPRPLPHYADAPAAHAIVGERIAATDVARIGRSCEAGSVALPALRCVRCTGSVSLTGKSSGVPTGRGWGRAGERRCDARRHISRGVCMPFRCTDETQKCGLAIGRCRRLRPPAG